MTSYGLDIQGIGDRFPAGTRELSLLHIKTNLGPTHLPTQWVKGALSVNQKEREVENTHLSSNPEVKNDAPIPVLFHIWHPGLKGPEHFSAEARFPVNQGTLWELRVRFVAEQPG
jgi:hypothetical protein